MIKKITAILLALLTVFCFAACGNGDDKSADNESATATDASDSVTEAETEPATEAATEPETEAPKRDKFVYIDFYTEADSGHSPQSLLSGNSNFAVRFNFDEGHIDCIDLACPSWSDDIGSLTFRVYKWDTDYETTIAGTAVAEEIFEDYADNSTLSMTPADEIGAGEYLFWVGDPVDEGGSGVGFWYQLQNTEDEHVTEYYYNGTLNTTVGPEGSVTVIIPAE